jgi:hypothetical protein
MESVDVIAAGIVSKHVGIVRSGKYQLHRSDSELQAEIAAALTAERAKFAAFADENGEPRKVLGTLPLTVEGDIIGDGAWCWFIFPGACGKDDDKPARVMYRATPIVDPDAYSGTRRVHSTKQAAEAAAGGKK